MEELFQREAAGEQLRGALHHLSIAVRARAGSAPNRVFHEKIIRTRGLLAPRPLRKLCEKGGASPAPPCDHPSRLAAVSYRVEVVIGPQIPSKAPASIAFFKDASKRP